MKPLTLDFPHRVTIELPGHVRRALREVADREPHENDEVLLLRVLSRGIVATMAAEIERQGDEELEQRLRSLQHGEGSKLQARVAAPFAAPGVRYRQKHKERLEQAERDIASANEQEQIRPGETRRGLAPRHMDSYLASPISEKLRGLFENYLSEHPDMTEEDALVTLVQLGLTHLDAEREESEPGVGPRTKQAEKQLRLAECLYRRAAQRCQS